jgi:ABC-type glycerol-3-phosphate transport system substrate-binding protein
VTMKTARMLVLLSALLGMAACGVQGSPGDTPAGPSRTVIIMKRDGRGRLRVRAYS